MVQRTAVLLPPKARVEVTQYPSTPQETLRYTKAAIKYYALPLRAQRIVDGLEILPETPWMFIAPLITFMGFTIPLIGKFCGRCLM